MVRLLAVLIVLCTAQLSCAMDMVYNAVKWDNASLDSPGSVNAATGNGVLSRSPALEPLGGPNAYVGNFPTAYDAASYIDCSIDTTNYHGLTFRCFPGRNDVIGPIHFAVEISTNGQAGPFTTLSTVQTVAATGGNFGNYVKALPVEAEDNPNVVVRFRAWGGTLPPRRFGLESISVTATTFQPIGVADAFSVDEDTTAVLEANVSSPVPSGTIRPVANDVAVIPDTLEPIYTQTIHGIYDYTQPAHGTLTPFYVDSGMGGQPDEFLNYVPNPGYNGPDSFTYRARVRQTFSPGGGNPPTVELGTEPYGVTKPTTVNITVNEVFDPPQANDDQFSTAEGLPLIVAAPGVLGNDTLGDLTGTPTVFTVSSVTHGNLDLQGNGSFTYQPAPGYNGDDAFVYALSDGLVTYSTATVYLSIGPINDAPVTLPDSYVTFEDTPLTVLVADGLLSNDTDIDGDVVTANLVQPPVNGALTLAGDGSFNYVPNFDFAGTDSFTYQATDGLDNSAVTTVTIAVSAINDDPALAQLAANAINENGIVTISGKVVDSDVTDSHLVIVNWADGSAPVETLLPAGVSSFSVSKHFLDDNPSGSPQDVYAAQITVSDFQGGSDTENVNVVISNVAPQILNLSATSPITSGQTSTLTGVIVDPGTLDTFVLSVNWGDGLPAQVVNLAAGSQSFSLSHVYPVGGNYPVSVQLTDDDTGVTNVSTNVVVTATADLSLEMSASPDPAAQDEDFTYSIQVRNNGPETATNVVVTDVLASHLTVLSTTPNSVVNGNTVTFFLPNMPVGDVQLLSIRVLSSQTGVISNTATVGAAVLDPAPANNSKTISNTIGFKDGADLITSFLNLNSVVCKKGTCTVKGTLMMVNRGNQPTNFSLLRIYLSDDSTLDGSDQAVAVVKVKKTKALQTILKKFSVRLPKGVVTSGKRLIAKIDDTNLVAESVETNNTAATDVLP